MNIVVHLPSIGDREEALPAFDNRPQALEGFATAIAEDPCQNSGVAE